MSIAVAQPIAGVSANRETEIEVIYPSVAAGTLGRLIGSFMGLAAGVPTVILRSLMYVLLGSIMLVPAVLAYALSKILGKCYVLTNRSVYSQAIVGGRPGKQVLLSDIAHIQITSAPGYKYHRVGDLQLENAQGNVMFTIPAISFPERLKQIILDARAARMLSDESLTHINARKP